MEDVRIVEKFKEQEITVIGDVMLDHFIYGIKGRVSSEAPVNIVTVEKEVFAPGAAANVAKNVVSLSGQSSLIAVVGSDSYGEILVKLLYDEKIGVTAIEDKTRPTNRKMRVVTNTGEYVTMLHWEKLDFVTESVTQQILDTVRQSNSEIFIVSDYGRGMITPELLKTVIKTGKKIIIDPFPIRQGWDWRPYQGAYLITPNRRDLEAMSSEKVNTIEDATRIGLRLSNQYQSNFLIKIDQDGMVLVTITGKTLHFPTLVKNEEVICVSGCGDSIIATVGLAISADASLQEACEIANMAAEIVIKKPGTAVASFAELKEKIKSESLTAR